jgi:hypothetical protein
MAGARSLLQAWLVEVRLLAGDVHAALDAAQDAVSLATRHGERGHMAWALRARAEAEAQGGIDSLERATKSYREAIVLAGELEMRPLVARCRLGLGILMARVGQREPAAVEFAAARRHFGEMAMDLSVVQVDAALDGSA